MAEQESAEQPPTTSTPPPPKTEDAAEILASPNGPPSGKPEEPAKPVAPDDTDPMHELLHRMERFHRLLANDDPSLSRSMQALSQHATDVDRHGQPGFRHQVAYALQDLEKSAIGPIWIAPELRQEMTHLAGTAPGLENERMQALMRSTASLENKTLIAEIRGAASRMGQQEDQSTADVHSRIDALENQVRLTKRAVETANSPRTSDNTAQTETTAVDKQQPGSARAPAPDAQSANNGVQAGRRAADTQRNDGGSWIAGQGQQQQISGSILNTLLAGMRNKGQGTGAPWDPPPTPMAERLSAFEKKMMESHDERAFENALKSGRAALDALQGFSNGAGATVMSRINAAARSEPGGMASVLSEMRDGGRFADLRKQFSNAMETDLGVAAAYGKAAAALGRYAQDRSGVQDIIGRRPDASAVTARFEQMDAEIGKAASSAPSRNDGRSMIEDLSQKAAEILQCAAEAVKSAFSRSPLPDATSRPSPSPS